MTLTAYDLDWLTPNLAVGGKIHSETYRDLAQDLAIEKIVDLRDEGRDQERLLNQVGIELLHLPTPDLWAMRQADLWKGVLWVRAAIDHHQKVLIHCQHGIGRSATLACCALVTLGHSPVSALKLAKRTRGRVSPSPEQLHAFLRWCKDWDPGTNATWDELADIAYGRASCEDTSSAVEER